MDNASYTACDLQRFYEPATYKIPAAFLSFCKWRLHVECSNDRTSEFNMYSRCRWRHLILNPPQTGSSLLYSTVVCRYPGSVDGLWHRRERPLRGRAADSQTAALYVFAVVLCVFIVTSLVAWLFHFCLCLWCCVSPCVLVVHLFQLFLHVLPIVLCLCWIPTTVPTWCRIPVTSVTSVCSPVK